MAKKYLALLECYWNGQFDKCLVKLGKFLGEFPGDYPAHQLTQRCLYYKDRPAKFTGVEVMESK